MLSGLILKFMSSLSSESLVLPCNPVMCPWLFPSPASRGNSSHLLNCSVYGPSFLFHGENRSSQKGIPLAATVCQIFFFLSVSVTTNELFVLLKPTCLTCSAEVIPSSLSKDLLLQVSLLSVISISCPLLLCLLQ